MFRSRNLSHQNFGRTCSLIDIEYYLRFRLFVKKILDMKLKCLICTSLTFSIKLFQLVIEWEFLNVSGQLNSENFVCYSVTVSVSCTDLCLVIHFIQSWLVRLKISVMSTSSIIYLSDSMDLVSSSVSAGITQVTFALQCMLRTELIFKSHHDYW